ncbi:MAG: ShlB/FhaC/HecB family hemolysin secretion/activation protein [Burkholderiales bacterium]
MAQTPAQAPGQAPSAAAPEPKFDIRSFIVEGATLLPKEDIEAAVRPFTGNGKDFADVQRALEALERAYTDKGYSAVQVILPEQELDKGEVRFKIVEARIARLVIEGSKFFDEENIARSLTSLRSGEPPNIHRIADNLRVANENPAKQTTVLLRGGSEEGQVDAVVRVTDERPTKYSVTMDNTGTQQTGLYRLGFGYQNSNVWNRDHVFSMQYVTSPSDNDHPASTIPHPNRNVFILGASYRVPLYSFGDSLDVSVGYSNVNSGLIQNLFNVSGSGSIFGLRYNANLRKWGEIEQRLAFGLDWRGYRNRVTVAGAALVPDVTVHPISVTYYGVYRTGASETSFNAGVFRNLPGGNDGHSQAFEAARAGGEANYFVARYGINHLQAFANEWQMRLGFNGQLTRDRLVSGEQFGIGGADSVRGFLEREVVSDNGYRGTVEFYTPDYASKIPFLPGGSRLRSLFFYDFGLVQRYRPLLGEQFQSAIASYGIGLRFSRGNNLSMRFDYGVVADAGGTQGRFENRAHATFSYVF